MLNLFHINRITLTFVSTSSGIVNTQSQLLKTIQGTNSTQNKANKKPIQQKIESNSIQLSWSQANFLPDDF